jgi:hypothetical protein
VAVTVAIPDHVARATVLLVDRHRIVVEDWLMWHRRLPREEAKPLAEGYPADDWFAGGRGPDSEVADAVEASLDKFCEAAEKFRWFPDPPP